MSGADPVARATHRCGTGEGSRSTHGSASVSTQLYEMPASSVAEEDSDEELADTQNAARQPFHIDTPTGGGWDVRRQPFQIDTPTGGG